jgi:hypothetical protein
MLIPKSSNAMSAGRRALERKIPARYSHEIVRRFLSGLGEGEALCYKSTAPALCR